MAQSSWSLGICKSIDVSYAIPMKVVKGIKQKWLAYKSMNVKASVRPTLPKVICRLPERIDELSHFVIQLENPSVLTELAHHFRGLRIRVRISFWS